MKIRRVGAYGVCSDADGRVLLARNSSASNFPGEWTLPGGGVDQGEHPDDAVVREFGEETGLTVRVDRLRAVVADVRRLSGGDLEHTDRVIYQVSAYGGGLRPEIGGTTDLVEWVRPAELAGRTLMPFTAQALGLPPASSLTADPDPLRDGVSSTGPAAAPPSGPLRKQRFGVYALATDPAGRILLTRIAPGYPGAGLWHLPGGGTDHGELPEAALTRELYEETSQKGRITDLLGVSHRHDLSARGPEGVPIDWHGIRVLFRVEVDLPTEPVVSEDAGSTAVAAWVTPAEVDRLDVTELTRDAVSRIDVDPKR